VKHAFWIVVPAVCLRRKMGDKKVEKRARREIRKLKREKGEIRKLKREKVR
jgi:hypothetical protein